MAVEKQKATLKSTCQLKLNATGKIDVRGAVGNEGIFTVIKDLGLKETFSGQTPIVSGEIGEDFTYFMAVSEQVLQLSV